MSERNATKAMLEAIARGEDRTSLFWWMVEHHDEIIASAGTRISWVTVCARATQQGLMNTKGQPFTTRNARETWLQARRAVAKARASVAEQPPQPRRRVFPSRISPDWRPQVVIPSGLPQTEPARAVTQLASQAATSLPRFSTIDPAGNPLPPGHVFHDGNIVELHVAEMLDELSAEAAKKDSLK